MTLSDAVNTARKRLSKIYEPRELNNILHLLSEELLELPKVSKAQMKSVVLNDEKQKAFSRAVERLTTHEPIQYILGFVDFFGMKLKVNEDVLIPRPETEELVSRIIQEIEKNNLKKPISVLDIGTGSGCISIALKKNLPKLDVTAVDKSKKAIQVALENAKEQDCKIKFIVSDFLEPSNWDALGNFGLIVSNPPYVTQEEFETLDARVKEFEPKIALIAAHEDPFIFYKKIAEFAVTHLNPTGKIFLELNNVHSNSIAKIFTKAHFNAILEKDLYGNERFLIAGHAT